MAEELQIATAEFAVDLQWPQSPEAGGNAILDASLARFEISANGVPLTSFQTDAGIKNTFLTIPTYYLVEWLAQNWWSFLYEPRKLDRSDADADFRSRHWLATARNGFALPDVLFVPSGETIEITARPSYLRFAQVNFTEAISTAVHTKAVRSELSGFINKILDHLRENGCGDTEAHQAWRKIADTSEEEEHYCRLLGSMGLSPYVEHPEIDKALEEIAPLIPDSFLADLCEASTLTSFARAAEFTGRISGVLEKSAPLPVGPILNSKSPVDGFNQAYAWGYDAAGKAREILGIRHDDPHGRLQFFERLGFDPKKAPDIGDPVSNAFPIQGAVARASDQMKLALSSGTDKEFSSARASFLAWLSKDGSARLVTTARTREQRASRAFGAELLAPKKYLSKRLGKILDVSPFTLDKISNEIGVASTIVRYQATNSGYRILDAA